MRFARLTLFAAFLLPGCTADLADPSGDALSVEAAEAVAGPNAPSYFAVRRDFRRCIFPLCGGYWISPLNQDSMQCARGRVAAECYTPVIDWRSTGLTDAEGADFLARTETKVLQGRLLPPRRIDGFDGLQPFSAAGAWLSSEVDARLILSAFRVSYSNASSCRGNRTCKAYFLDLLNHRQDTFVDEVSFLGLPEAPEILEAAIAEDALILVGTISRIGPDVLYPETALLRYDPGS